MKMIKRSLLIAISIFLLSLSACSKSTANNSSPAELYKQDNSIDFIVYNKTAYVNASNLDWVKELNLESNKKLGEIERTGVFKKFIDYDATLLEVGTEFYSVIDRDDFVLVITDNKMVPYYAYVEG